MFNDMVVVVDGVSYTIKFEEVEVNEEVNWTIDHTGENDDPLDYGTSFDHQTAVRDAFVAITEIITF